MRLLDPATQPDAIEQAAQRLADGGLLALPTETVYGLGARADDDAAVARIFEAKGRPSNHPLIVHVANAEAAWQFAAAVPLVAQQLMDRFWPGPLTVIVPRAPGMAAASAGGQDTIGLRCPDHPVALKLLQAAARLGVMGVAAPSANRFGRISPTRAEHVIDEFQDQGSGLDEVWVLQGGLCEVGIESTIVDCTRAHPVILRPGRLTRDEIEAAAGEPVGLSTPEAPDTDAPRASGTLAAHYAPRAKLRLMSDTQLSSALDLIEPELTAKALANKAATPPGIAVYSRSLWAHRPASPGVVQRAMPADAISAAHHLFSDLRELDALGVELIWVEKPPVDPVWDGVRDRLARAAAA
ncbi:L-threonylcarbamoyladenylate synthase [Aquabacterium sp.]|uniref:L-threonylcarbamoyladenylate synthase n=1 Tax=Aquabacterium sp. TaxID=1872578 RepID=UPI00248A74A2|nr:L-threonylcarbamoyladenylate synthase [Aquabacterium sp.]MDI1260055.1 L-threonylcarbamoyladenylate synthase [Aquabacterium sp.]